MTRQSLEDKYEFLKGKWSRADDIRTQENREITRSKKIIELCYEIISETKHEILELEKVLNIEDSFF